MSTSSGIYQICNITNGHIYIGSAVDIQRRWKNHISDLRNNKHHSGHLQNAFNKYGKPAFVFEIIELCDSEKLLEREQHYLDLLHPEYNISPTAGRPLGIKRSKETLLKMSIANTGKPGWWKGKTLYPETKKKLSERLKGNSRNKGKTHSSETRAKISSALSGRTLSDSHRLSIGTSLKGKTRSVTSCQKTSDSLKGRVISSEWRKKLSESRKAWWRNKKENEVK